MTTSKRNVISHDSETFSCLQNGFYMSTVSLDYPMVRDPSRPRKFVRTRFHLASNYSHIMQRKRRWFCGGTTCPSLDSVGVQLKGPVDVNVSETLPEHKSSRLSIHGVRVYKTNQWTDVLTLWRGLIILGN